MQSVKLMTLYQRLYRYFGPQQWWPLFGKSHGANRKSYDERLAIGDKQFEICVGAILTQNTAWTNVEKALRNLLHSRLLNVAAIARAPLRTLRGAVKSAGYFNQKARKLKIFARFIQKEGGFPALARLAIPALRARLLGVWGIGRETADSMILYAFGKPIFVIDTYTKRLLDCFGLRFGEYDEYRDYFEKQLPRSVKLWNEYHALIVAWGKLYAKDRNRACALLKKRKSPGVRDVSSRSSY